MTRNIREANGTEKKTRRSPMGFLATTKPEIVGGGIGILGRSLVLSVCGRCSVVDALLVKVFA